MYAPHVTIPSDEFWYHNAGFWCFLSVTSGSCRFSGSGFLCEPHGSTLSSKDWPHDGEFSVTNITEVLSKCFSTHMNGFSKVIDSVIKLILWVIQEHKLSGSISSESVRCYAYFNTKNPNNFRVYLIVNIFLVSKKDVLSILPCILLYFCLSYIYITPLWFQ